MKLKILLITCFFILIISCEKESALEKYYYQEGNFSGSIYDALDSTENHNYFIQGIDSIYLSNQLKNTLVTVIAPSDKAFKAYLEEHGYDSLSDIPIITLEDLIGHHLIEWPHSPASIDLDPLYFKRRSNMASGMISKYNPVTKTDLNVLSEVKYLQFYSTDILNFLGGNEDDYRLLTGQDLSPNTGYNIYNVPVDSVIPYGNGWVFYVDQIIEPVQNLDEWLLNSDYSLFSDLFLRFANYDNIDGVLQKLSNLYQTDRNYRIDMQLCFENVGYYGQGTSSSPPLKARSNFTVFAPNNQSIESFIDTYLSDYPGFKDSLLVIDRGSIENLHLEKVVRAMIAPYMFVDQPVLPSQVHANEGVSASDGTLFKFSEQDIIDYNLCSNGYAYGLNKYEVPRSFKSILKPVYTSNEFKYFAAVVEKAKIAGYLNNLDAEYTLMLPTDSAFIKNNILLVDPKTINSDYPRDNPVSENLGTTYFMNVDPNLLNGPEELSVQALFGLVFNHLFTEIITPPSSHRNHFAMNAIGNYVGINQDRVWSGGNIYVSTNDNSPIVPNIIRGITGSTLDNGKVYVVDELIKEPELSIGDMLKMNPAFSLFKDQCEKAGLFLNNGTLDVYGDYPTVFIPSNDALDSYISGGYLPNDEEQLKDFIKYFFIDKAIFTVETIEETVKTLNRDEELSTEFKIAYKTAEIKGTYGDLKIKGSKNTSYLNVIEGAESNIICTDGIIHQIDGVLN